MTLQDGRDLEEYLLYYVTSNYFVIQQCLSVTKLKLSNHIFANNQTRRSHG